jgi:hypothetical protein
MTSFQSKRHWDCFLPHRHKITWNGYCSEEKTISIFRVPPEDANSKFLRNTATQTTHYPNLHNIMFIHHCENLKKKTQWMVHAGKTELQVHIML